MLLREPMIGSNFSIEVGVSYEISNFVIVVIVVWGYYLFYWFCISETDAHVVAFFEIWISLVNFIRQRFAVNIPANL